MTDLKLKGALIQSISTGDGLFSITLQCTLQNLIGSWNEATDLTVDIKSKEAQKEQKPAEWSEEDEDKRYQIIEILLADKYKVPRQDDALCKAYDELIAWLKSLRPHWKPSEEQMEALRETIDFAPDTFKPRCTLESLYEQLKRLKDGTR